MDPREQRDGEGLLHILAPLIRPGTLLERMDCSVRDTFALQGGTGGSHLAGVAFVGEDEAWPRCDCGVDLSCALQVDGRDARHATLFPGLFVVFELSTGHRIETLKNQQRPNSCAPLVRYYPSPTAVTRRSIPVALEGEATRLVSSSTADFLPHESLVADELPPALLAQVKQQSFQEAWETVYSRMMKRTSMASQLYDDHLGGWHVTNWDRRVRPPDCPICAGRLALVVQLDWGDGNKTLWACPEHPGCTHYEPFHK